MTSIDTKEDELVYISAYHGYIEIIKTVLEHGWDINKKNYRNYTILCSAVEGEQYELCEYLIKNGADVNVMIQNKYKTDKENLLMKIIAEQRYYRQDEGKVNIKLLQLLIDSGCDVNFTNNFYKDTVLLYSVYYNLNNYEGFNRHIFINTNKIENRYEVVECLLKNGANVNIKNKYGSSPLHMASSNEYYYICKLLVEYGADVLSEDNDGHRASYYSNFTDRVLHEHFAIYNFLKQKEAERELLNQSFKRAHIDENI
jgi:ankyrin repeat protein